MTSTRRKARMTRVTTGLTLAATLIAMSVAARENTRAIFRPFRDPSGALQSATADPSLDGGSPFFDPTLGTNGQACSTCHEPGQGFTITLPFIRDAFETSSGLDPLFRANDTADRPDADPSTLEDRRAAFDLFLQLGVVRIGKTLPAGADFTVAAQDTPRFGPLPNPNDPQAPPGSSTLSLFRRPLVNTNVHFDSAVLWDGRASITDMRGQVKRAARTLLLAGGPSAGPLGDISDTEADDVAAFMLGVFTDQISDDDAGRLSARGASGGVAALARLASDPAAPCTPLAPATCTPVAPGTPPRMTLFDAWANVPDHGRNGINGGSRSTRSRAAVVRGQALFNELNCKGCHGTNNVGNNPSEAFFRRLNLDSPDILAEFAAEDPRIVPLLDRVRMLPQYCLRLASSVSTLPCESDPDHVMTTDPGRALVTGRMIDVGKFKPPILRGLAIRAPFFHNGAAETLDDVVNFYNAIFDLHLTDQQHADLVAFLRVL
jgi:cytochrome c peroxidase